MNSVPIASGIRVERDVRVHIPDGVRPMVNVYRPVASSPAPVLLSVTPYGKAVTPDRISMLLMAGSSLQLDVLGHDAARYPGFRHERTVNRGRHSVHTGGRYPSALIAPFVNQQHPGK